MGQSFKNRDEKQEFIDAMTNPKTGWDWSIAMCHDGPILRAMQAEVIKELEIEVAHERMIERILMYIAKQDKIERAEQFEREYLASSFTPQGVNGAPRYSPDGLQDKILLDLKFKTPGELKDYATQLVNQLAELNNTENRIVEEVKVLDRQLGMIDTEWKTRQEELAAKFVIDVGKTLGLDLAEPANLDRCKRIADASKRPSPVDIVRINPDANLSTRDVSDRGDVISELKVILTSLESEDPVKSFFAALKKAKDEKTKPNFPKLTLSPDAKKKNEETCEKGLICTAIKKKKEAEAKEVKEEKNFCEKSLEKVNQLIRHKEMLLPPNPDDIQK